MIRPGRKNDLDDLVALENATFDSDQMERRSFRHAIGSPTIDCYVVEADGKLVGYALVERRRTSRIGRLTSIAVSPDAAGGGIGRRLLAAVEAGAAEQGCDRLRLEVRADNARARAIYDRSGYRAFETIPDYYEDGTPACRYEKPL